MQSRFLGLVVVAALLVFAVGCGGGRDSSLPDLVPVSGTVTLDGKPLAGAIVTFLPVGATKGRSCYGVTGADGRYELMENEKSKGAPVGEFSVLVNKWVMPDGSDFPKDSTQSAMDAGARELLPPQYSLDGSSTLKATVPAGGGTVDFQVTSK
jgi:hypothetical protein